MDSGNSSNNTRPPGEGYKVRERSERGKERNKGRNEEAYREINGVRRVDQG